MPHCNISGTAPCDTEHLLSPRHPTEWCLPLFWMLLGVLAWDCSNPSPSIALVRWGCWRRFWLLLLNPTWSHFHDCMAQWGLQFSFFSFCLLRTDFGIHLTAKINRLSLWLQHQLKSALTDGTGPEDLPSFPQTSSAHSHPGYPLSCGQASPSHSCPTWVGEWLRL